MLQRRGRPSSLGIPGATRSVSGPMTRPGASPGAGLGGGVCGVGVGVSGRNVAVPPRETGIKDRSHACLFKLALYPVVWGQALAHPPPHPYPASPRQECAGLDGGLVRRKLRRWDSGWVGSAFQVEGTVLQKNPAESTAPGNLSLSTEGAGAALARGGAPGTGHRSDLFEASCKQGQEGH